MWPCRRRRPDPAADLVHLVNSTMRVREFLDTVPDDAMPHTRAAIADILRALDDPADPQTCRETP